MPTIQLVALDLDGTLLDSSEAISPANRSAIKRAQARGVRVVLITGRGADAPLAFGRDLGLTDPIICAHGALTKDCPSGRDRRHVPIPREYATALIEFAQEHRLDTAVYTGERFHRIAGAPRYMDDMQGPLWVDVSELTPLAERDSTFIRFFGRAAVDAISTRFNGLPVHFKFETWGSFEELAITSEEATKERALTELCGDLQVDTAAVMAIGDSRNDVPMLRWAGVGVAMANALPEVIEAAPFVTASNDEDGVARAIERFVLEPREGEAAQRMMQGAPTPEYEARLRKILSDRDWQALREFTRAENEIPDDVYAMDQHFWEVMLHKLICNRIDMLADHAQARAWLDEHGYTTDIGGH